MYSGSRMPFSVFANNILAVCTPPFLNGNICLQEHRMTIASVLVGGCFFELSGSSAVGEISCYLNYFATHTVRGEFCLHKMSNGNISADISRHLWVCRSLSIWWQYCLWLTGPNWQGMVYSLPELELQLSLKPSIVQIYAGTVKYFT